MKFDDVKVGDIWGDGVRRILVTYIDACELHALRHDGSTATWSETEYFFFFDYKLISRNNTVIVIVK